MDIMCVLICLQVCFRSDMKHKNDASNMVGNLQVVRIYSFMKEIKVYIHVHASYIIFFFVTKRNNFIILVICAFLAWLKPLQSLWKFLSRWKLLTASQVVRLVTSNNKLNFVKINMRKTLLAWKLCDLWGVR